MANLVFIKSIPRESVSRISDFRNDASGKKLNKNKLTPKCKDGIQALYSPRIGGLKTGLYKMYDENTTLQDYAERKWGLPKGTLHNKALFLGQGVSASEQSYFQRKTWKLNDGTTVLDLDKLDDFCFYHVCLESRFVANSEKEWKEHKWPKATHYIAMYNESDELKFKKTRKKAQAMAALTGEDFTPTMLRKMCVLMELLSARIEPTQEQTFNILSDLIQEDRVVRGKSQLDKFMSYVEALKTADGRARFDAEFLLQELIAYNIVLEKTGTYTYLSKGQDIGYNLEEALNFMMDKRKQAVVEDMEKELKAKKLK